MRNTATKKLAIISVFMFMSVLCFSEVLSELTPDCSPSYFISRLNDEKTEYSVSSSGTDEVVTIKNIEVYTPDSPGEGKSIYGDVLVYFSSDRLYKVATKHHDAELFKRAKLQCETDSSGNKIEVESGQQYIIEDEGIICTLIESSGEYTMVIEYNSSLIPINVPWYQIRLHPEKYADKTIILDKVSVFFSSYVGATSDWIGSDAEIVIFNAETDGDAHGTSYYPSGLNFRFCMTKESGERCLQEAHDENGTRMIVTNAKCRLYKERGDNDNWYVVILDAPWWSTSSSAGYQYK